MKMIDLLNKIANGEISEDTIVEFDNGYKDYCSVKIYFDRYVMDRENLNNEVEILNEEKKIPEKLNIIYEKNCKNNYKWKCEGYNISTPQKLIADKVNSIIDYLKSKGE